MPLLLLLLLACPALLRAQDFRYSLRPLPTQRLLPVAAVHCLLQDREGYLWYGTEGGGLCRDNGYQVDVFRSDRLTPGLMASNAVTCLAETRGGQLLCGTRRGLYLLDKTDYSLRHLPVAGDTLAVDAVLTDARGDAWVAVPGQVWRLSGPGLADADSCRGLPGGVPRVARFHADSRGRLWALLWSGAILRAEPGQTCFAALPWPVDAPPTSIVEDTADHCYWVGTWGKGIVRYDPSGQGAAAPQPASSGRGGKASVLSLLRDSRHGLLWATTLDDLYAYRTGPRGLQSVDLSATLPAGSKIVDQLLEDRQGNLYVAAYTPHSFILYADENGIRRWDVPAMRRLTGFPLLADNAVAEGSDFWIWQGRLGLTFYQTATDRVWDAGHLAVERNIQGCRDRSGVWAAAANRLLHVWFDGARVQAEEQAALPGSQTLRAFHEGADGRLWLATDDTLYVYSLVGRTLRRLCPLPSAVHDMTEGAGGALYLAARQGFYRWDGTLLRLDTRPRQDFTAVATGLDGEVWATTHEGNVYCYDPASGTLRHDEVMSTPNGDAVKQVRTDALGHVWLLSDQYVREFNPRNHSFRTLRNTSPFVDVSYFYSLSPVGEHHFCLNGAGAICVLPSSARLNLQGEADRPTVSAVVAGGRRRLVGEGVREVAFAPAERDWELQLTTFDHLHADHICFAYQLQGLDDHWTYLPEGANTVFLHAMQPGTYTLLVRATDRHGCWGQPVDCLRLRLPPPWHQTWWARLLLLLLAAALAGGLWLLRRRIAQLAALQQKRSEIVLDQIELHPAETEASNIDGQFLQRAVQCVERHLDDSDYTVERFSSDMCMSRMNLYRRLQSLTGQTPTEFVRDLRLKKAARLLLANPDAPVAEVAAKVGFATPSYFTKCFKQRFGLLPTQYGRQKP